MYEQIIFLQGDQAIEALEIEINKGNQAAIDHLSGWHHPGEHATSSELGAGASDFTIETEDGYILTVNHALGYIGLEFNLTKI